ncbi:MAG: alpha/beta fold hydrolase [Parachlamydiales bacterium]
MLSSSPISQYLFQDPSIGQPSCFIDEIPFFDNPSSCIAHYENTSWAQKALYIIESYGTFFHCLLNKIYLIFYGIEDQMHSLTVPPEEGFFRRRLVVCLHGLGDNPSQFKKLMDEMENEDLSETDFFIPEIIEHGRARLDDMVSPILETIGTWAQTAGDKELVLVGTSNGARIARAIEAELIHSERVGNIRRVKFVSIVGACKGSSLANLTALGHQLGLSLLMSYFVAENIIEEMPTTSERNAQLNRRWEEARQRPNAPRTDYTFIASPHDWLVPNFDSTLMETNAERSRYALVPGHGHCSIINASAKTVASIILNPASIL